MTKLTEFEIQFFELTEKLKHKYSDSIKSELLKTLLKLNNPTFYYKFTYKNPIERHGYKTKRITNPILQAIPSMISIINSNSNEEQLVSSLQKEISWAYQKYTGYLLVDL